MLHVFEHLLVGGSGVAFAAQLVEAALSAGFSRCVDVHLHLGIGEYGGADVAAVHHNAFVFAHGLLLSHQGVAHEWDGCNGADTARHAHVAYLTFHVRAVEVGFGGAGGGVDAECDGDAANLRFEGGSVHRAVVGNDAVVEAIERHGAIHGAAVDVGVSDVFGKHFSHCAFARRRESVDCYGDYFLSHCSLCIVDE